MMREAEIQPNPGRVRIGPAIVDVLRALRAQLEERFPSRVRKIVLFGSHARGESTADSDIDVLVLIDGLTHAERSWIYEQSGELFMSTMLHIATLALATDEFRRLEELERRIAHDIDAEGIPF